MYSQRDIFSLDPDGPTSAAAFDTSSNAKPTNYSVIGDMRVGTHGFGCIQKQGEKVTKVTMPFDKVCPFEIYGKIKLVIVDIADLGFPSLQTTESANRFFDHFKTVFLDLIKQLKNGNISYQKYTEIIQDNLFQYEQIYITESLQQIDTLLRDAYESVNTFWQDEFMEKIFQGNFDPVDLQAIILELNDHMEALTDYLNLVSKFMDNTPGSSSVRLTTYKNYGKYAKTPFAKKIYSTTPQLLKNSENGSISEWNAFFDVILLDAELDARKFCAFDFETREQNAISLLPRLEQTVLYESPRVPREFITSNIDLLQSALSVQDFSIQETKFMLYQDGSCYHSRFAYKNGDRYAFTNQSRIMEGIDAFKKKTKNSIELRAEQVEMLANYAKQKLMENDELCNVLFDGLKLYKDIQHDFKDFKEDNPELSKQIGKDLLKLINTYHNNALYKEARDLETLIEMKYPGQLYGEEEKAAEQQEEKAAEQQEEKPDEGFRRPIFKPKILTQPVLVQPRLILPMVLQQQQQQQQMDLQPIEDESATNKKQKIEPNEMGGSIRKKTRNKRINILKKRRTTKRGKKRKTKKQKK
jgi:hypothetical protein